MSEFPVAKVVGAVIAGVVSAGTVFLTGVVEPVSLAAAFLTAAGAYLKEPAK